jgi:hypothetical protein
MGPQFTGVQATVIRGIDGCQCRLAAAGDELDAEVAEVGDGAEGGEAEAEEDDEGFERGAAGG